jgi:hypothetical protein
MMKCDQEPIVGCGTSNLNPTRRTSCPAEKSVFCFLRFAFCIQTSNFQKERPGSRRTRTGPRYAIGSDCRLMISARLLHNFLWVMGS